MTPKYLTVTALTFALKRLIEEHVSLEGVWIQGEISNFTSHASGHLYFTLKDETARLQCVMFKSHARTLTFRPANGQAVALTGRLSVYEKNGNYQLYVEQMTPDGLGGWYQLFEELKARLASEGLFAPERKRALPPLPQMIGLITSPTGAAVQDMIKILRRRRPNLDILIFPALVQGTEAPRSLVKALGEAARFEGLDLVIIGRGGGSVEELWCFNDEHVARAIAAFPKPVIAAVGHETDFTIADFVADLRAPTPSAAAELAVPDQGALVEKLGLLERRLERAIRRGLDERRREMQKIAQSRVLRDPYLELNRRRQDLDWLEEKLLRCGTQRLAAQRDYLTTLLGKLDALSPLATLERGYAIVRQENGHIIKDEAQVIVDEVVRVRLVRGALCCRIIGKEIEV